MANITDLDLEEKKIEADHEEEHVQERSSTTSHAEPDPLEHAIEHDLDPQRTQSTLPPPPDGGLHAWLKVVGGFFIYINIWYVCNIS